VASISNAVKAKPILGLPTASVTVSVQLYVASARLPPAPFESNVIVCVAAVAEPVTLSHPPPQLIVPASSEENETFGV